MTLAMLVILFKGNKWLFLMLFVTSGFAFWGINLLISKLFGKNIEK